MINEYFYIGLTLFAIGIVITILLYGMKIMNDMSKGKPIPPWLKFDFLS